jgi:hypothetical protein
MDFGSSTRLLKYGFPTPSIGRFPPEDVKLDEADLVGCVYLESLNPKSEEPTPWIREVSVWATEDCTVELLFSDANRACMVAAASSRTALFGASPRKGSASPR